MSEFSVRLREKLTRMTAQQPVVLESAYDEALQEFVDALNAADLPLYAEVAVRASPPRRMIVTRPKYRRTDRSTLLSFWIDGPRIHVLGEGKRSFSSVEELEAFLDDWVEHSSFPETVANYRELEGEPVMGYLRTRGAFQSAPEDVVVRVEPEEQKRLATAAPGTTLSLNVAVERFPGAGVYDQERSYIALESAGFAVDGITHSSLEGSRVSVLGAVTDPNEDAPPE